MNFKRSKGFTLIELLVVVAIISLLTSVVLASLRDARQKAEIAATRQYLHEVMSALEIYKTSHGNYPSEVDYPLSDVISTYLSEYITFQKLPPRIADVGTSIDGGEAGVPIYVNKDSSSSNESCGDEHTSNEEPYFIYFYSSDGNLGFSTVSEKTGGVIGIGVGLGGGTTPIVTIPEPEGTKYCMSLLNK